ncbi:MAG: hypothetical protein KGH71_03485 [Candidatus Micrarchaeota archaeon]|nr:hypothetical protein [Candidatus Micrarchaeota archaeon]
MDDTQILAPVIKANLLDSFLDKLGFILTGDHCNRNCLHCPAYGDKEPMQNIPFSKLEEIVKEIAEAYEKAGKEPNRTIASWRINDPLDYYSLEQTKKTTYDVAKLWRTHFKQGLYIVTNGAEGRRTAIETLINLVKEPDLVSQIKLTITPCDIAWGTEKYLKDILKDIEIMSKLWNFNSERKEDLGGLKFRINVKTTKETEQIAKNFIKKILSEIGYGEMEIIELVRNKNKISFKPIYDLGAYKKDKSPLKEALSIRDIANKRFKPTEEQRSRYQYAIFPNGLLKLVDMYAFSVLPVLDNNGFELKLF